MTVDAAGYRERREEMLHRQADQAASRAARSGRPVALDAMSATERKVVHEHLKDRDDVETYSEGTEPNRHLVVAPRAEGTSTALGRERWCLSPRSPRRGSLGTQHPYGAYSPIRCCAVLGSYAPLGLPQCAVDVVSRFSPR